MNRWLEIELFVASSELKSLTRAADALGLSSSSASRYLAALEARLGVRLIERSTRRITLTELGEYYLARCKAMLVEMAEADAVLGAAAVKPRGTIRITGSFTFCHRYIAPLLPAYNQLYPDVRFSIEAANRYPDLLESGMDLAIRTREFEADSNLTVRRLAATDRPITASPSYLERAGCPTHPSELARHQLLLYTLATKPNELVFRSAQGEVETLQARAFLQSNDSQVLCAAAVAGTGLLIQPKFSIHEEIESGRLVEILPGWKLSPLTINLAYPSRKYMSAKVRTFIDFLVTHFEREQYEQRWTG